MLAMGCSERSRRPLRQAEDPSLHERARLRGGIPIRSSAARPSIGDQILREGRDATPQEGDCSPCARPILSGLSQFQWRMKNFTGGCLGKLFIGAKCVAHYGSHYGLSFSAGSQSVPTTSDNNLIGEAVHASTVTAPPSSTDKFIGRVVFEVHISSSRAGGICHNCLVRVRSGRMLVGLRRAGICANQRDLRQGTNARVNP